MHRSILELQHNKIICNLKRKKKEESFFTSLRPTMSSDLKEEIINVTQGLLDAIANNDWAAYLTFVDEKLTCFEPEARGQLITGEWMQ
jgi:hypothetical protein